MKDGDWVAPQTGNSHISTWQVTYVVTDVSSRCLTSGPDFQKCFWLLNTESTVSDRQKQKRRLLTKIKVSSPEAVTMSCQRTRDVLFKLILAHGWKNMSVKTNIHVASYI